MPFETFVPVCSLTPPRVAPPSPHPPPNFLFQIWILCQFIKNIHLSSSSPPPPPPKKKMFLQIWIFCQKNSLTSTSPPHPPPPPPPPPATPLPPPPIPIYFRFGLSICLIWFLCQKPSPFQPSSPTKNIYQIWIPCQFAKKIT